jgi:hypothetical protein
MDLHSLVIHELGMKPTPATPGLVTPADTHSDTVEEVEPVSYDDDLAPEVILIPMSRDEEARVRPEWKLLAPINKSKHPRPDLETFRLHRPEPMRKPAGPPPTIGSFPAVIPTGLHPTIASFFAQLPIPGSFPGTFLLSAVVIVGPMLRCEDVLSLIATSTIMPQQPVYVQPPSYPVQQGYGYPDRRGYEYDDRSKRGYDYDSNRYDPSRDPKRRR